MDWTRYNAQRWEPIVSPPAARVRIVMRIPGANVVAMFRGYDRELVCSHCRSVIAWIRLRPFR